jgi:adenosylhomocysteine nucleosidase
MKPAGKILRSAGFVFVVLLSATPAGLDCSMPPQTEGVQADSASYLAVMSAYSPELIRLLAAADLEDTCRIEGTTCYFGALAGNRVILLLSGIGLEDAAATTRTLLDSIDVTGIVFSGIAGGINPNLRIGDVTIPAKWGWADGPLTPTATDFWIPVSPEMLDAASRVSRAVTLSRCTADSVCLEHTPSVIPGGNGVSNSFFVDDPVYREWLWGTFEANAVDMETAAVARIARDSGISFIAFRSLSDLAGGGPGENEIGTFFQLAADNAATVVLAFLEAWAKTSGQ